MSYRVRYTFPDGRTGHWMRDYATREDAQRAIDGRRGDAGLAYTVEEVPEPGSTAAHHVEILRTRVKELEEIQKAIHRDLAFALQLGGALREAMRTGEWRAGHDRSMASSATSGWDRWKTSLAASPQGTAKASEAPVEGGDSGSSSFEALEAFLRADTCRSIQAIEDGRFIVLIPGYIGSPASRTLKGISASVEQMVKYESKWLLPISRPKDKFGEGTNLWRLNALERFLDGDDAASLTWHEGEFHAVAEDMAITAPTLAALADKLAEMEAKP